MPHNKITIVLKLRGGEKKVSIVKTLIIISHAWLHFCQVLLIEILTLTA